MDDEVFTRLVAEQAASGEPGSWAARERGLLTVFGTIGSSSSWHATARC